MIESSDLEHIPTFGETSRGSQIGPGLLFIVTQLFNLQTGAVQFEGRPLRENHQCVMDIDSKGRRSISLDGRTVILSAQALAVYRHNMISNPRLKLPEWIVTNIFLMDARQYQTWLTTGELPT